MSRRCWTPLGPVGVLTDRDRGTMTTGEFQSVAMDPNDDTGRTVYVGGAAGGLWKSTDEGITWVPIGDRLPTTAVSLLAVGGNQGGFNLLVAATGDSAAGGRLPSRGVTVSHSDGGIWEDLQFPVDLTLKPPTFRALAIASGNNQMWLATQQGLFWRPDETLSSWSQAKDDQGHHDRRWSAVVVTGDRVIGGIGEGGTAQSLDGLYSTPLDDSSPKVLSRIAGTPDPLPAIQTVTDVALAVSPTDPNVVYAAFVNTSSEFSGFFRSLDGGATWHQRQAMQFDGAFAVVWPGPLRLVVHPHSPDRVYLLGLQNVWVTEDGGATPNIPASWNSVGDIDGFPRALTFSPVAPFHAWLATDRGVFFSEVEGVPPPDPLPTDADGNPLPRPPHWQLRARGLATLALHGLAQHPTDRSVLLAAALDRGALRYRNHPLWERVLDDHSLARVAIDPHEPTTWYAASRFKSGGAVTAVQQSKDSGKTWRPINDGLTILDNASIFPLVVDPNQKGIVYLGTERLYRWDDAHREVGWHQIASTVEVTGTGDDEVIVRTPLTAVAVAPSDSNVIYMGNQTGQVYRLTKDAGSASWTNSGPVTLPLTRVIPPPLNSTQPPTVGTARVEDAGISSLAVSYVDPNIVYATIAFPALAERGGSIGDIDHRLFKSTDGGKTWDSVSLPFVENGVHLHKIVIHPDDEGRLYLATDKGVYTTTIEPVVGQVWHEFSANLPRAPVSDLLFFPAERSPSATTPLARTLRAATFGRGVWERLLDQPELPCGGADIYLRDDLMDTGDAPTPPTREDPVVAGKQRTSSDAPDLKVERADEDGFYETFRGNRAYLGTDDPAAFPDFIGFELLKRDAVEAGKDAHVYLQVHNRGPSSETVKARVLFAREGSESSPLPADPFGPIPATSVWQPVGDTQEVLVQPAEPAVVGWTTWHAPPDLKGHVLMVALADASLHSLTLPAGNIDAVARNSSHAIFRSMKAIATGKRGWFRWWMIPAAVGVTSAIIWHDDIYDFFRGLASSDSKEPGDRA